MSFGALGTNAKRALGMGFSRAGLATCTGEGGMLPEEREASDKLIYQMTPSRYGLDLEHLRMADAIEIVVGQGAKPGTGGMLLGMKVSEKVARDAHAAGRRRPALGRAPPRLPGRRRPRGQDRGAARGHRLPRADHPQARRLPRRAGRQDRRQDRLRRDRRRRHGGLDRGLAGVPARPHGRADADGDPGRAPRARGDRHVRQDHADRLGRHPQRRRRRQGARARRRLRRDRHRRR